MVVVVLISVLAVLATPAMRNARDDRLTFDFARRIEQLIQHGRTRAAGRGAAELFVASPAGGTRGEFLLFEALDGTPGPTGPNPISTCRGLGEWNDVLAWAPGVVGNSARLIDGFNMNDTAGVVVNADIRAQFYLTDVSQGAIVMCVTPLGTTYVGVGSNVSSAIVNMQAQVLPFNSFMEIRVTRNNGGVQAGLARRVLTAGTAAPRIKSE
jgi:hypothetical protein